MKGGERRNAIIRELRGAGAPVSGSSLAKAVGVSFSALCMYETGRRVARDEVKLRLADYYGVPVESIFFAGMSRNETNGGKNG